MARLRMSSKHGFVRGGRTAAARDYQERDGKYVKTGARERDATPATRTAAYQAREGAFAERNAAARDGASPAADYQARQGDGTPAGKWETRGDLLHVGVTMPTGAKAEWRDTHEFWQAVEANERAMAEARPEFRANSAAVAEFRRTNTIAEEGRLAVAPLSKDGKPIKGKALAAWARQEIAAFKATEHGQALAAGGLVIKPEIEHNAKTGRDTLYFRAQSKAEWMAESSVGMKGHFSLSNRLTPEEAVAVTDRFRARLAEQGLWSSTAIHWKTDQHHFHFMTNLREIQPDGTFAKGRAAVFRDPKKLAAWERENRAFVAQVQNEILAARGEEPHVEFRSDRELAGEEIDHDAEDIAVRVIHDARRTRIDEIRRERLDRAIADPASVREEFSRAHATFSKEEVADWMTPSDASPEEVALVVDRVFSDPEMVAVGEDMHGRDAYSTRDYLAAEQRLTDNLDELAGAQRVKITPDHIEEVLSRPEYRRASDEQRAAVRALAGGAGLVNVVGRAGVGKTTLLRPAVVAAQESGHRVLGMSQYGNQAKKLGRETGIESKTVRARLEAWRQLDEIHTMLRTGRLTEKERQKITSDLEKSKASKAGWAQADVRDKEGMLRTGRVSAKHRRFLEGRAQKLAGDRIKTGDIYVLDEAGLTGTRDGAEIAERINKAGAALWQVGDDRQNRSLDAGEPFRASIHRHGAAKVTTIRRQRRDAIDAEMARSGADLETAAARVAAMSAEERAALVAGDEAAKPGWQAEATMKLAEGETVEGVKDYMRARLFDWTETRDEALAQIAGQVVADIRNGVAASETLAILPTNKDTRTVNLTIKAALREGQAVPEEAGIAVDTESNEGTALGEERFHVGDRLAFLRNENRGDLVRNADDTPDAEKGVRNGERGTVEEITEAGEIVVRLDRVDRDDLGRVVVFDPAEYRAVALGWAITATKSQGESVEAEGAQPGGRVYALLDETCDEAKAYVAASRHTRQLRLYADRETFPEDQALFRTVERGAGKTMAADLDVAEADRPSRDRVAALVRARTESTGLYKKIHAEAGRREVWNHPDWPAYESSREAIKAAAQPIAADIEAHREWLDLAKITVPSVEVDAGLRHRTVSLGEEKLRERMRAYAQQTAAVRDEWNRLKSEAGSTVRAAEHPDYPAYDAARQARDAEAAEIAQDPRFRKFTRETGVPAATILAHAKAHADQVAETERVAALSPRDRQFHDLVTEYREARQAVNGIQADIKQQEQAVAKAAAEAAKAQTADQVEPPAVEEKAPDQVAEPSPEAPPVVVPGLAEVGEWVVVADGRGRGYTGTVTQIDGDTVAIAADDGTRREASRTEHVFYHRKQEQEEPHVEPSEPAGSRALGLSDAVHEFDHPELGRESPAADLDSLHTLSPLDLAGDREGREGLVPSGERNHLELAEPGRRGDDLRRLDDRAKTAELDRPAAPRPWAEIDGWARANPAYDPADLPHLLDDEDRFEVAEPEPEPPTREELRGELADAQRRQDALAAKVQAAADRYDPDWREDILHDDGRDDLAAERADWRATAIRDGEQGELSPVAAELAAQKIDLDRLALDAARHEITVTVERYQEARARGLNAGADRYAADIMAGTAADRKAGSGKLMTQAVLRSGLDWKELRAAADRHAVRVAPAAVRDALPDARKFIDARRQAFRQQAEAAKTEGVDFKDARAQPEVLRAYRAADAAAAKLAKRDSAAEALTWWQDRERAQAGDRAPKPVTAEHMEEGAARHHADMDLITWRATPDAQKREAAAARIVGRLDADRHAVGQAPADLRPALPAARDYLDARRQAFRQQGEAAKAAAVEFRDARRLPEIDQAHRVADAKAADLVAHGPGRAGEALTWWQDREDQQRAARAPQPPADKAQGLDDLAGASTATTERKRVTLADAQRDADRHERRQPAERQDQRPAEPARPQAPQAEQQQEADPWAAQRQQAADRVAAWRQTAPAMRGEQSAAIYRQMQLEHDLRQPPVTAEAMRDQGGDMAQLRREAHDYATAQAAEQQQQHTQSHGMQR